VLVFDKQEWVLPALRRLGDRPLRGSGAAIRRSRPPGSDVRRGGGSGPVGGRRERLGCHRVVVRVLRELGGGRGLVGRAIAVPPPSWPGGPAYRWVATNRSRFG